jgi:cobalamin-dependent methionine synthase I
MKMKRYSVTDIAKAVTMQAAAAAYLEEYLNNWQYTMKEKFSLEGKYLRPRFSPGYGDFNIEYQKEIIGLLDTSRKIGLTLTDGCMLVPTKSVTALIGISRSNENCMAREN